MESSFSLHFISTEPEEIFSLPSLYAEIRIGSFCESFVSPVHYWSKIRYESQWLEGLERILSGNTNSALITKMTKPVGKGSIVWWPLYRKAEVVVIHNHLLLFQSPPQQLDPQNLYELIPPYERFSDDNQLVSEWEVMLKDLELFHKLCKNRKRIQHDDVKPK